MSSLETLPCASILVRIVRAPLSNDGLRVLGTADFEDKKEWVKRGIWKVRKKYSLCGYNSQYVGVLQETEIELFSSR